MADSFIIADAGGTSTQWRVVVNGNIEQFETIGFNAYTHNLDDLKTSIRQTLGADTFHTPTYFYAAGVDTLEQQKRVTESLSELFNDHLEVDNDLVGVARSLCGRDKGNVCILGTGSNACYYDGQHVSKVSSSLGYVLGDEGSGAYLGKKLMMGVFREHFGKEIITSFQHEYHLTSHEVIQRIYHEPRPNHFLASFATFIHKNKANPEMYALIKNAFEDYFDAFFSHSKEAETPFSFSGSIAWYFSDILREVAVSRGYFIKNIVQSPIAGLVLFHQG